MTVAWLNPAGGLRYHARAHFGARLWLPFQSALNQWLSRFETKSDRAVLVGPSAAYCLSNAFLQRFSAFTLLDPDPIATFLLGLRLRRLGLNRPTIERQDQLVAPLLEGSPGLAGLLRADPEASVIFCNVLGQTRFLTTESDFARFKSSFCQTILPLLADRAWLSFHDRLSGALAPTFAAPLMTAGRLSDAEVMSKLYAGGGVADRAEELFDHESDGFFPGHLPHCYFAWQIDAHRHHLIEAVASRP
jgi:hypothetical protein